MHMVPLQAGKTSIQKKIKINLKKKTILTAIPSSLRAETGSYSFPAVPRMLTACLVLSSPPHNFLPEVIYVSICSTLMVFLASLIGSLLALADCVHFPCCAPQNNYPNLPLVHCFGVVLFPGLCYYKHSYTWTCMQQACDNLAR